MNEYQRRFEKIANMVDKQPNWRKEASLCHQYAATKQIPVDIAEELEELGLSALQYNLIYPAVQNLLGMEAKLRTDWGVRADDNEFGDVADALNERVNEALRVSRANRACSAGHEPQVVGGLGWVEVKVNSDPLGARYRVAPVHYDEIDFDMACSDDLSDCRWMRRSRMVEADEAKLWFPKHAKLIDAAKGQWAASDTRQWKDESVDLTNAHEEFTSSNRSRMEWIDPDLDMIRIYEIYYRSYKQGVVLSFNDGRIEVLDESNPMHIQAIASGLVAKIEKRPVSYLRVSFYIGIHHVLDIPSPHPHNYFPYVPFFGNREDRTNIPYGLVRPMLSPQDAINHELNKITALINDEKIVMDDNATDMSDEDLMRQRATPKGIIRLKQRVSSNQPQPRFEIVKDHQSIQYLMRMVEMNKQMIQDVIGIYNSSLGKESGATAGVAINSLVEQGATNMANIYDNYRWSRRMVGEIVMMHEYEALKRTENFAVTVKGRMGTKTRKIILNDNSSGTLTNAVAMAKTQVVLGEMTQSAGFRAQNAQRIKEMLAQLDPEIQRLMLPFWIEYEDLPEDMREKFLKVARKVTGEIDPEDLSEQEKAALQQKQQKDQLIEQMSLKEMQLRLEEIERKLAKATADTQLVTEKAETENMKQREMALEMTMASVVPPPLPPQMRQVIQ